MAYYNLSNSSDSENLNTFLGYINRITENLFFPVMLLVVWFIAFISIYSNEGQGRSASAKAFTVSSFFTSVLSIMLVLLGYMSSKFMYLQFILVGIGIVWLKMEQR